MSLSSKVPGLAASTMRAVVVSKFGDPSVLQLQQEVPIPKPNADEVLVKVGAIGINPVDTYIRTGTYSRSPLLPYTPGNDMCGTVIFAGKDVKEFKEGDRVASFFNCRSGSYAEYCCVHQDFLIPVPADYDFKKGAAIGVPYFTAFKALFVKSDSKPSDTVLIHGASGGVGIACCQLAMSRGMSVIGTAGTADGMNLLNKIGVKRVFNHREEGYTDQILKSTDGKGVNVIVEMLSNVNLNEDLKLLAYGGVVAIVGCRGSVEINPRMMMAKESRIQGVALGASTKEELSQMRRAIAAGIQHGWIDPCVGPTYSLSQISQTHEDIIVNSGTKGKMVVLL